MKIAMLQVTVEKVFNINGSIVIPAAFEMKQTEDGVNYIIREEEIEVKETKGTSDTGPR